MDLSIDFLRSGDRSIAAVKNWKKMDNMEADDLRTFWRNTWNEIRRLLFCSETM